MIVDEEIAERLARRVLECIQKPTAPVRRHLGCEYTELAGVSPVAKHHVIVRVQ